MQIANTNLLGRLRIHMAEWAGGKHRCGCHGGQLAEGFATGWNIVHVSLLGLLLGFCGKFLLLCVLLHADLL